MASLIGQKLGKYHITRMIARGGMADVYRAKQEGLDRDVAVKVMHVYLAQADTFVTRFKREASSVAKMRHPHIIQLYDFDTSGDHYYMVMEYISGRTLEQLIREQGKLSLARVLEITLPLADALEYAHGLGIIHRDIKPTNIMFTDSQCSYPILADFGINLTTGSVALTMEGGFVGTPGYMSPEASLHKQVDKRADIYSLGVVLYEMITGQPPFMADSVEGLFASQLNDPMPDPRLVVPDLPDEFVDLLQKCLAANPDDRFNSLRELIEACERIQHRMPDAHVEPIANDPLRGALLGSFDTQAPISVVAPSPSPTPTRSFEGAVLTDTAQSNATPAILEEEREPEASAAIVAVAAPQPAPRSFSHKFRLVAGALVVATVVILSSNSAVLNSVAGKESPTPTIHITLPTGEVQSEWTIPSLNNDLSVMSQSDPISVSMVQATEVIPTKLTPVPTVEPSPVAPTTPVDYEPARLLTGDNVMREFNGGQAAHAYWLDAASDKTLLLTLSGENLASDLTLELTNQKTGEIVALLRPAVTAVCIRISPGTERYDLVVGADNSLQTGQYNLRLSTAAQTQLDCPAPTASPAT